MAAQVNWLPPKEAAEELLGSMATISEDKRSARMQAATKGTESTKSKEPKHATFRSRLRLESRRRGIETARQLHDAISELFDDPPNARTVYRYWTGQHMPTSEVKPMLAEVLALPDIDDFEDESILATRKAQVSETRSTQKDVTADRIGRKTKDILRPIAKAVNPDRTAFDSTVQSLWRKQHLKPLLAFFVYWLQDQDD